MEKTLIILKPDAVQRSIVGEIITRFEKAGFKIVAAKMLAPDEAHYFTHYETIGTLKSRKGDDVFNSQLATMQVGPVISLVLEGVDAIDVVRKMVGATEPKSALPGTIRGDYAHASFGAAAKTGKGVNNIVHASATKEEADKEIAHWFKADEIHDYKTVHEDFTQPKAEK